MIWLQYFTFHYYCHQWKRLIKIETVESTIIESLCVSADVITGQTLEYPDQNCAIASLHVIINDAQ